MRSKQSSTSLVLDGLAVYRITRLIVKDTFPPVKRVREAVETWAIQPAQRRSPIEGHALGELVSCPHCMGFWVAAAVVAARLVAPRWWDPIGKAFALAGVVSLVAEVEAHTD